MSEKHISKAAAAPNFCLCQTEHSKKANAKEKIDLKCKNMVQSTHMDLQYHCTHLVDRHEDDYWKTCSNIQFNCKHD